VVAVALVLAAAVLAAVLHGGGGASSARSSPAPASSSAPPTSAPASATPTTPAPTTTAAPTSRSAPRAIRLAADQLTRRPVDEVRARLTALGLRVRTVAVQTDRVPAGQVVAVDPVGELSPGETVTVGYAAAPPTGKHHNRHGHGKGHGKG
jgi:serine/threonine-protein kinase